MVRDDERDTYVHLPVITEIHSHEQFYQIMDDQDDVNQPASIDPPEETHAAYHEDAVLSAVEVETNESTYTPPGTPIPKTRGTDLVSKKNELNTNRPKPTQKKNKKRKVV